MSFQQPNPEKRIPSGTLHLLVLCVTAVALAVAGSSRKLFAETSFTVNGNVYGFQDTGVDVTEGDVIWISADGTIAYNAGGNYTNPDGYGLGKNGTENATGSVPVVGAIFGSLVGRIGSSTLMPGGNSAYSSSPGEGFIGTSYVGVLPESGRIYLAYNDGGAGDNSGAFNVSLSSEFIVDGTIEGTWLDTGLDLDVGDVLTITASGQITYSPSGAWTDPDGFGSKDGTGYGNSAHLVPNTIFGSLVGRIGDTLLAPEGDSPYISSPGEGFIGSNYQRTITNAGRLYLAYNDGGTDDNGGFFSVNVNVVPEPASTMLLIIGALALLGQRRNNYFRKQRKLMG